VYKTRRKLPGNGSLNGEMRSDFEVQAMAFFQDNIWRIDGFLIVIIVAMLLRNHAAKSDNPVGNFGIKYCLYNCMDKRILSILGKQGTRRAHPPPTRWRPTLIKSI
jgi:hypothetical protein